MEKLDFSLILDSTYSSNHEPPIIDIFVDDQKIYDSFMVDGDTTIDFPVELNEGNHLLKIIFKNKKDSDVLIKDGKIVKDKLLHISHIEIDTIDITKLSYENSAFYPSEPRIQSEFGKEHRQIFDIGWNGEWILEFSTPIYLWMLNNL